MRRIADRMVPHQLRDPSFHQQRPDRRKAGFERQIRAMAQVEHALFGIDRGRTHIDQRPAPVKYAGAKRFGHIDILDVRRAERRYEQDELQIRHAGILNIQLRHVPIMVVPARASQRHRREPK